MNLADDPTRNELLFDLDSDDIMNDGFMENPERRRQIEEFVKWLHTKTVKKEFAIKKLQTSIKNHHIAQLRENLDVLSVRPMGTLSENDPGGMTYQRTLGDWETKSMAEHDKRKDNKLGGKKGIHQDKLKKTKKNKTKKYRKTRRLE
jgi:hypothetical protein